MKKTFLVSLLFLAIGILLGTKIYTATTSLQTTFSEGETYYFLQAGSYSSLDILNENTQNLTSKITEEENNKFYVYVGITKSIKNAKKIKKVYENQNYTIYIKEVILDNVELSSNITQFDLLLNSTDNPEEIITINEVVLANYEEIIKKWGKHQKKENNTNEVNMSYKVKEIPITERPRERLKQVGPENLSDKELLAIILKTGTKNKNVTELALEILKEYPISELKNTSFNQLVQIKGIGEVKALELLATIELGKRLYVRENKPLKKLKNAKEIFLYTKYLFIDKQQENFYALYFNNRNCLLSQKCLFIGTINESIVHPREVFKEAYRLSAAYIICIHNHPTNDTTPSIADINFTEQLTNIGKIQGIKVIDHIIVGHDNYYSFYEQNKTIIKEDPWKSKLRKN